MTVSLISNRASEVGTDAKFGFDFSFRIFDSADLNVYKIVTATGVKTLQTLSTDYSVAFTPGVAGGTVTYVTAPLATETSFIIRAVDADQDTALPIEGGMPETTVEAMIDKNTILAQDAEEEIGRAIKMGDTSSIADVQVEDPVANRCLVWEYNSVTGLWELNNSDYDPDTEADAVAAAAAAAASAQEASDYADAAAADSRHDFQVVSGQDIKYTDYTLLIGDVGKVIVFYGSDLTCTLPTLSAPFNLGVITIVNHHNTDVTVTSASLIRGQTVLKQFDCVTYEADTGQSVWRALSTNSSGLSSEIGGENLLKNGSFDSWLAGTAVAPDGWVFTTAGGSSIAQEATVVRNSLYSAEITTVAAGDTDMSQAITLATEHAAGGQYLCASCWVYCSEDDMGAKLSINGDVSSAATSPTYNGSGAWYKLKARKLLTTDTTVTIKIECNLDGAGLMRVAAVKAELGEACSTFTPKARQLELNTTEFDTSAGTGTIYQVATDTFFFGYVAPAASKSFTCHIGASSPPATQMVSFDAHLDNADVPVSFFVPKGWYFEMNYNMAANLIHLFPVQSFF